MLVPHIVTCQLQEKDRATSLSSFNFKLFNEEGWLRVYTQLLINVCSVVFERQVHKMFIKIIKSS